MYKTATKKHRHSDYNDISADLARIKEAINETALDMKGKAGDLFLEKWENAKTSAENVHDSVGSFAKERPMTTIGLTLLAGVVVGFLIRGNGK